MSKAIRVQNRFQILNFLTPEKFRGEWAKCLSKFYEFSTKPVIYFWRNVSWPSDSERGCQKQTRNSSGEIDLFSRRHCIRTTKYDRLLHKFRHRSTRLCVGNEHRFTKFSEITQCNGHYTVQGHSRSPILVLIENSYMRLPGTSYLTSFPSYDWLLVNFR